MTRAPLLARTSAELADALAAARDRRTPVVLVPTMGALHEGHASLIRTARERAGDGRVVVSVFVNPMQFGPGEDLDRYPRTLDDDLEVCAREGADVVFLPEVAAVYPRGVPAEDDLADAVTVDPGSLATVLEGKTRSGHFRGVLTVVAKLFGLVQPDLAVFGEKDYQQLVLVRRMVSDLCLPVEIVGGQTVRESDGLALSSRNGYLDAEQRRAATALYRTLLAAQEAAADGVSAALDAAQAELRAASSVDLDYLTITTPELAALPSDDDIPPGTEARILIAARVGATRLIDNLPLVIGQGPAREASPHDRERSPHDRERSEPGRAEQEEQRREAAPCISYERSE